MWYNAGVVVVNSEVVGLAPGPRSDLVEIDSKWFKGILTSDSYNPMIAARKNCLFYFAPRTTKITFVGIIPTCPYVLMGCQYYRRWYLISVLCSWHKTKSHICPNRHIFMKWLILGRIVTKKVSFLPIDKTLGTLPRPTPLIDKT
jgi:hypothetical protein